MTDTHTAFAHVDDLQELSPEELSAICGGTIVEEPIVVTAESPLVDDHVMAWRMMSALPLK